MLLKSITAASSPLSRSLFVHLLKRATTLSQLAQLHAQLLLHGLSSDIALSTKLIHKLFLFNSIRHAHSLFLSIPNPDLFLFNALIKGFSHNHLPFSAISIFSHLRTNTHLYPDDFTYSLVISASTSFAMPRVGLILHGMAVVDGFGSDLFVGSALVDMYFKLHSAGPAVKVFDRLPSRDIVLCNTLISGLVRTCCFEGAIKLFKDMVSRIDSTTVVAVLPAVAELQELRFGTGTHCLVMKLGLHLCISVVTSLISLYSKCGDVKTAELLFRRIGRKDLVCYNAMISGYTCNGETECAVRLFTELVASEKVCSSSLVGLIPVYSPFGHLHLTNCIHGFCLKAGTASHSAVSTALITVYSRLNEMELARKLFDEPTEKTLASWNAMISGYTQNGFTETAISLFQEMQTSNVSPNPVTVTSILSACAQLGVLSVGKWVHSLVKDKSFEDNIYVSTALIDMYAKCGSLSEARQLFDLMPKKNVVTWNAMIAGYGLHGHGHKALKLFHKMLSSDIAPTKASFLCVLYACSHAGLVTEANKIFNWMVHGYGYEPLDEHYACMVDIFGRAGNLQGALQFIKGMPVNPGPPVWGAFLGACMIQKDSKLAHMASERLLELDTHNMGYYVLMSNIYSAERNYPLAALMRQTAKQRKLIKTPGCTLIEINQVPYVFVSGDRSHPQSTAIYAELEKLAGKMKEAGYQAETINALHDVEEEEKELLVKVHSEKLAIAFGLVSTEPGTEIRIIKNLRVCLDCHTATKYISKITERVIVVRDANRFHHFKDGSCSCGDYW